jgi:hypothetical protein
MLESRHSSYHYLVKIVVVLAVIVALNLVFRISFSLPIPRLTHRMPVWIITFVEFFEIYGWLLIVAMILAGVWQIAEKH